MTDFASNTPLISRRGFLGSAAGLGFAVSFGANGLSLVSEAEAREAGRQIGVWVRITPDDRITIVTPAAEMGQGSMTGVPVALAEEMDADWAKVTLEMAPADPETYGYVSWGGRKSMGIYGSLAMRSYYGPMRMAGAQVFVQDPSTWEMTLLRTEADGTFTVERIRPGSWHPLPSSTPCGRTRRSSRSPG